MLRTAVALIVGAVLGMFAGNSLGPAAPADATTGARRHPTPHMAPQASDSAAARVQHPDSKRHVRETQERAIDEPSALERIRRRRVRVRFERSVFDDVVKRMSELTETPIELDSESSARLRRERVTVTYAAYVPSSALAQLRLVCELSGLEVVEVEGRVVVRDLRMNQR